MVQLAPPLHRLLRRVLICAAFLFAPAALAQQSPGGLPIPGNIPPEQARALLASRPDLAAQVRERIAASGLTPDQVRARLRAAGYPEDLLDAYLSGADTTRKATPGRGVLEAIRTLGVVDATAADSLAMLAQDTSMAGGADSAGARRDTSLFIYDSLGRATPKLSIFGLSVFRQRTSQFAPTATGPVDGNYRLGPGDMLVLILTGDVEQTYTLDVTREGFVVLPQVGQLYVANLTLDQLEDLLYTRLGRVFSGVRRSGGTTRFSVTVSRLRNLQLFVAGDVVRPGSYLVSSAGTALTALYAAGGPTERGSLRRVEIRRGEQLVGTVDVYGYLLRGQNPSGVRLQSGDVVFIPPRGNLVAATGALLRPARYELLNGETLRDLLRASGGYEPDAVRGRLQIHRQQAGPDRAGERIVLDVTFPPGADSTAPTVPLLGGDSVVAFSIGSRVRAFVTLRGAVQQEGRVGLADALTLSGALRRAGGLKPDALIGPVLVTRLRPDSTRVQLRATLLDSTGATSPELPLQEDDEITVFSRVRLSTTRFITITGAVRKGGRLPYRDGMTLRDAVLLANGVTEDALLTEAEVARLPANRERGVLAETIRVPLDSTYVYERDADGRYLGPTGVATAPRGAPEVRLEPYDNVLILRQPEWELLRRVSITGQVRFPGSYSLRSRTERLADLIGRAGGLTAQAYPAGVEFHRAQDRKGRIGIDLPKVLRDPRSGDNLILTAGDSIVIPEFNPVVTVAGAVNSPVAVTYVPGRNADFYIAAAGGFSRLADKRRTYITQPTGKLESGRHRRPLPGGRVFVPSRDPNEPRIPTLQIVTTLASVLASLATIVIVSRQ